VNDDTHAPGKPNRARSVSALPVTLDLLPAVDVAVSVFICPLEYFEDTLIDFTSGRPKILFAVACDTLRVHDRYELPGALRLHESATDCSYGTFATQTSCDEAVRPPDDE
jgi:hypothetical protein